MANTKVYGEQIVDGSITAAKLADGTIVAAELANNAVETAAINADAVTGAKIADDAIDSEHYVDGSIDTAHIANDQVTQAKIADDAVGADQLAASAVVTASIVDDNVTTAKIADGNISTAKLADLSVTSGKLANNIDIAGTLDVTGATVLDSTLGVTGALTGTTATFTTADNTATLTLISTDADADVGPNLNLYRNSGSPADNDALGKIVFNGRNDNSQDVTYGLIESYLMDASDGTEDGEITIRSMVGGTSTNRIDILPTEIVFNQSSNDLDFRVESDGNAHMLFVDGGNNVVRIGTSASSQTISTLNVRRNGANIEYGHSNNGAGYYGTLGAFGSAGYPYIGFSTDCEDGANTFSTRGHKGNIIWGNLSGDLIFSQTTTASATGQTPAERMRIASDGKVGIGDTTPAARFTIKAADNTYAGGLRIEGTDETTALGITHVNGDNFFSGNATDDHITLKGDGNVGIGTATPAKPLSVYAGDASGNVILTRAGTSENLTIGTYYITATSNDLQLASSAGMMTFSAGGSERMRISSSGNLLINTTTDTANLYINQTTTDQQAAFFYSNTSNTVPLVQILQDGAGSNSSAHALYVKNDGAGDPLHIESTHSGGDCFKISYLGEVQITRNTFYVSSEGAGFSAGAHNGMQFAVNGQSVSSRAATNTQTHKSFYNPNGSVGTITTNGSATAYNTSSDYRLKENIVTDWDGTTLLKQLKPSKFNFKADKDTTVQGFLAHEVSSIVPEAVSGTKDAVYTADEAEDGEGTEGQPKYQGIDHSKLVPLLVKTIQELEARIKTLEDS